MYKELNSIIDLIKLILEASKINNLSINLTFKLEKNEDLKNPLDYINDVNDNSIGCICELKSILIEKIEKYILSTNDIDKINSLCYILYVYLEKNNNRIKPIKINEKSNGLLIVSNCNGRKITSYKLKSAKRVLINNLDYAIKEYL